MIPEHLRPLIARQDASLYTPMDHASWRFILRISTAFFSRHAHAKYLKGLEETGISVERIPLVEEMDEKLQRFGWRAVPVSGFIPPAAFMEFQSLGILPIACEMRTIEHLAYTPAPDIVHEAAGHAPIIADREYVAYLREYGEVARKAIFSSEDMAVFEAIRELSDLKEDPRSTPAEIASCEQRLEEASARVTYVSEATLLARMNWWTVEYGLVGDLASPRIYGAGLLSSVGESYHCLDASVRKIPFSIDCVLTAYDITRPQPQLFVTPDFGELTRVLREFAETMAFRQGGLPALEKAKACKALTTSVLDSGVQVSGRLEEFRLDSHGQVAFLKFGGPCQISREDREIEGQGPAAHRDGFSTPVGRLSNLGKPASALSATELLQAGFAPGKKGKLRWESGIELEAELIAQDLGVIRFQNCTISWNGELLYRPEWGAFDLAGGEKIISVFGGAADRGRYLAGAGGHRYKPQVPKSNLTAMNRALNGLYARVRALREAFNQDTGQMRSELDLIWAEYERDSSDDWLLALELLEIVEKNHVQVSWRKALDARLDRCARTHQTQAELIRRGREILTQ